MNRAIDGGAPGGGAQPQFTFQLAARTGQAVPKFHAMLMAPGTYRVSLVKVPGFTAFEYTRIPNAWVTEFYAYHHAHDDACKVVIHRFEKGPGSPDPDSAFAAFKPKDITIQGVWPLPVMFCIADAQDNDNQGGLSVLVEKL
jgi:hypothetical protein